MQKAEKIVIAITALVAVALIVAVVVGVVLANRNRNEPEPDVTVQNSTGTDTQNTEIPGTDIPVITSGTEPSGDETEPSDDTTEPDHVSVDIVGANEENEKDNHPHIVGEPSVIPGVKEANDETQN